MPSLSKEFALLVSQSFFMVRGAISEISCPHCNTIIKPEKDVISFWQGFAISFSSVVLAGKFYVKFIEDDFVKSMLFSACAGVIAFFCVYLYTVKKIKYIEF